MTEHEKYWRPQLESSDRRPLYQQIAEALAHDIQCGVLLPGERMPTLKALAQQLEITPGTVNRAYELAQRQGLIEGEVGRGTFVSARPPVSVAPTGQLPASLPASEWLDMAIIAPATSLQMEPLRLALSCLAEGDALAKVLDYTPDGGHPRHREAVAGWLQQQGLTDARWEQLILTAGAQHGLMTVVQALTRIGDHIACEALTYPGILSAIQRQGRYACAIAMDEEGMLPEALRDACRHQPIKMVICVPSQQNPTTAVMSPSRRAALAEVARECDLILVDDDLYGFLNDTPQSTLSSYAPERSVYLGSLSKSVAPAIRLGYLHAPASWLPRLTASVRSSIWMVSPLGAQLASQIINSGEAAQMAAAQREEARQRQRLLANTLADHPYRAQTAGFHAWLPLPAGWSSGEQFAALARANKLLVSAGESYLTSADDKLAPHLRLSLMNLPYPQLKLALDKLAGLLASGPHDWLY